MADAVFWIQLSMAIPMASMQSSFPCMAVAATVVVAAAATVAAVAAAVVGRSCYSNGLAAAAVVACSCRAAAAVAQPLPCAMAIASLSNRPLLSKGAPLEPYA